jgi:membrane protease YdiL (CAAX protease family)
MRPLHVLAFLLPLLVLYEVGLIFFLTDPATRTQRTIEARHIMDDFFRLLGIAGYLAPGFAMASVLLVWHIMSRDRWVLDLRTLLGMLAESIAWTLPLLVMAAAIQHARGALVGLMAQGGDEPLRHMRWPAQLTLSIGAGLYEEMLFRLVGLALLHFILADLIGLPRRWASVGAVLLSAVAFAVYHRPPLDDWPAISMYLLSGVYLGTLYVLRGFGIVVGAHAMYDVLVLMVFGAG